MIVADQSATEAFLQAQQAQLGPDARAQVIATHISKIYLAGERAFKLKRAVRYPYVDFSTPAARYAACRRELELNRRTAPDLYIAVRKVTRGSDGAPALDGPGEMIDAVVEMRRFDQSCLADAMAQRGALTAGMIDQLARRITVFHAGAEISRRRGGSNAMKSVLDINEASLRQSGLLSATQVDQIARRFGDALRLHGPLLDRRSGAGKMRRCHGDLILRNICVIDGVPTLFDCLEFNEDLATIDVLYDLAFLVMDLLHRGLDGHANALFNRYFDESAEEDGLALVSFFTAVRAEVRAHIAAARAAELNSEEARQAAAEAREYLDLALSRRAAPRPRLVAIGGRSGSGKSTVAAALAPRIGAPPGARILSSDRIRKRIYGIRPEQRLPQAAYAPDVSTRVYDAQRQAAAAALRAGVAVIADAVFDRSEHRNAIKKAAADAGVGFEGLWLEAPVEMMERRIEARTLDASDATIDVLHSQLARDPGLIDWRRIDAGQPVAAIAAEALSPRLDLQVG